MKVKVLALGIYSFSTLLLMGCSAHNALRNREMDYSHNTVIQRPNLVVPNSLNPPQLKPAYLLPKGQNVYRAQMSLADTLKPPYYDSTVTIPQRVVPSVKDTLQRSDSYGISGLFSWLNPNRDNQKKITQLKDQIAQIKAEINTKQKIKQSTDNHLQQSITRISSSLIFDSHNVGLLSINAPLNTAWTRIKSALKLTPYSVVKENKHKGLLYISTGKDKPASLMVYTDFQGGMTKVSVFTIKRKLDNTPVAYSLLEQIHSNLNK